MLQSFLYFNLFYLFFSVVPLSYACPPSLVAVPPIRVSFLEQEDLMLPYEQMELFYRSIFLRLGNADHDFMILGADGSKSSKHRVEYYHNVFEVKGLLPRTITLHP